MLLRLFAVCFLWLAPPTLSSLRQGLHGYDKRVGLACGPRLEEAVPRSPIGRQQGAPWAKDSTWTIACLPFPKCAGARG